MYYFWRILKQLKLESILQKNLDCSDNCFKHFFTFKSFSVSSVFWDSLKISTIMQKFQWNPITILFKYVCVIKKTYYWISVPFWVHTNILLRTTHLFKNNIQLINEMRLFTCDLHQYSSSCVYSTLMKHFYFKCFYLWKQK